MKTSQSAVTSKATATPKTAKVLKPKSAASAKPAKVDLVKAATLATPATPVVERVMGQNALLESPAANQAPITEEQRRGERRANVDSMAFAVQQLTTPVVDHAAQEQTAAKLAEGLAKMKEIAEQYGLPAAVIGQPAIQVVKSDKIVKNNITRPATATLCGKIWSAADEISAHQHGIPAAVAAVKLHPNCLGINSHTLKTQYARWRQFNSIKGKLPKVQAVHQVAGEYDGMQASQ